METCNSDVLRHLASAYHELASHEKSIDFLIDHLQKDQLNDAVFLSTLDKAIKYYEVIDRDLFQLKSPICFSFSIFIRVI